MALADGRRATGDLDRRAAAPTARRTRRPRAIVRLGVGAVHQPPAQLKLATLAALCAALDCPPGDLIEIDTTPAAPGRQSRSQAKEIEPKRSRRGRSMPPTVEAAWTRICLDCPAPVKFAARDAATSVTAARLARPLKGPCIGCRQPRHLRDDGRCAGCRRAEHHPSRPRRSAVVAAASSGATSGTVSATVARWPTRTVRSATPLPSPAGWRRPRRGGTCWSSSLPRAATRAGPSRSYGKPASC